VGILQGRIRVCNTFFAQRHREDELGILQGRIGFCNSDFAQRHREDEAGILQGRIRVVIRFLHRDTEKMREERMMEKWECR
jgi:hypothetical protein